MATCGHPEYESYDHGCENYDPATTWVFDDDPGAGGFMNKAAAEGMTAAERQARLNAGLIVNAKNE